MNALVGIQVATAGGSGISLNDLMYELKITQRLNVLENAVQDLVIFREAKTRGISVTDAELQQEADALRRSLGLESAAATQRWLRDRDMSEDDLEHYLTRLLSGAKLKDRLTGDKVESYFASHRPAYDSARIRRIVVTNADLAGHIADQLKNRKANFETLALEHSVEPTSRDRGGAVGRVLRRDLESELASAVFAANPGDIVGPIRVGGAFHIVRVDHIARAKLDAEKTTLVKDAIFREWLDEQKVDMRLGDLITAPAATA
jgi:putative peptide maturation system protein